MGRPIGLKGLLIWIIVTNLTALISFVWSAFLSAAFVAMKPRLSSPPASVSLLRHYGDIFFQIHVQSTWAFLVCNVALSYYPKRHDVTMISSSTSCNYLNNRMLWSSRSWLADTCKQPNDPRDTFYHLWSWKWWSEGSKHVLCCLQLPYILKYLLSHLLWGSEKEQWFLQHPCGMNLQWKCVSSPLRLIVGSSPGKHTFRSDKRQCFSFTALPRLSFSGAMRSVSDAWTGHESGKERGRNFASVLVFISGTDCCPSCRMQ